MFGKIKKNMLDFGKMEKCMEMEICNGQMERNILVNILMIKNKDSEPLFGVFFI